MVAEWLAGEQNFHVRDFWLMSGRKNYSPWFAFEKL
jgi:hypothetical protein